MRYFCVTVYEVVLEEKALECFRESGQFDNLKAVKIQHSNGKRFVLFVGALTGLRTLGCSSIIIAY